MKRLLISFTTLWFSLFFLLPQLSLLSLYRSYNWSIFDQSYFSIFLWSFFIAGICTCICILIAFPTAWCLTYSPYRRILFYFFTIPYWASSLVRVYAISSFMQINGFLNDILVFLGFQRVHLMYSYTAVILGLVYDLLFISVLPLLDHFERTNYKFYIDASIDLGLNTFSILRYVIFPISRPCLFLVFITTFLPCMTIFYIPEFLSGGKIMLIGGVIYRKIIYAGNLPGAAFLSVLLMLISIAFVATYYHYYPSKKKDVDIL